nr:GntR family transcriptional regulator [Paenactinomyces guangxiensis]
MLPNTKTLKDQAFSILKEAIIRGILHDGEMITERRALEQFHISRTPFREAVQSLEAKGWVTSIPYKGTFINPITIKDIHDIFELRLMLETSVVKKIQSNMSQESLNQLEVITKSMNTNHLQQGDYEFMLLDKDFHHVLFKLTNNQKLIAVFEQTSDIICRIGMRVLHRESRREEVIAEHQQIIDGLKNGTAEKEMAQHLEKQKQSFIHLYGKSD